MPRKLKPINIKLLGQIVAKNRPKIISTRSENGVEIKVFEANITTKAFGRLHYD